MSMASAEDLVAPGSIIAFEPDIKGSPPVLGLVVDRVGKKKSVFTVKTAAAAAAGGSVAVSLRQVRYVLPGGSDYQAADLATFEEEVAVDGSLLEEAWEMLLEEAEASGLDGGSDAYDTIGTSDPRDMAQLLFGVVTPTPRECYQAFRLLEGKDGALRFKRRRDGSYECRSRCACRSCDAVSNPYHTTPLYLHS